MSVIPIPAEVPDVAIVGDRLHVREMELDGTFVELAREIGLAERPHELARLFRQVVESGSIVVLHGNRRAEIDAIKAEIERLMANTSETTEKIPTTIQEGLNTHLVELAKVLDSRFDGGRTSSVQHQIKELVKGASTEQVKTLLNDLFGERGPLTSSNKQVAQQLKLVVGSNQAVVGEVKSLIAKLEQKQALDEQQERSSHKGTPFEDRVEIELTSIFGRLGDNVACVKHDSGLVPGSESGDFLVSIDPKHGGGREARIVVEAKTGKLSGPKSHEALETAMANRDAQAGVLVFDGAEDAPLGGRHYLAYPDGKLIAVLDEEHGTLAFEIACAQARLLAIASVAPKGAIDAKWLVAQCDRLTKLIEDAIDIKRGSAAARRGLDKVDHAYDDLREQANLLLDEIRSKLA